MVARLQRAVAQPFVDGEDRAVAWRDDAATGHEDLAVTGRAVRLAGPAGRDGWVRAHPPFAPLDDVPVVSGEHHRATRAAGLSEQRLQVPDCVRAPLGPAGVGAVERVVNGVEHATHQRLTLGVVDGGDHVVGQ